MNDELEELREARPDVPDATDDELGRARSRLREAIGAEVTGAPSRRWQPPGWRFRVLAPAGLAAVLAVGAAMVLTTGGGEPTRPGSESSLEGLLGGASTADYEPAVGPRQLVRQMNRVVGPDGYIIARASIDGFSVGRSYGRPENVASWNPTIEMHLRVDDELHGSLPPEAGGVAGIELTAVPDDPQALIQRIADLEAELPRGTEAIAYFSPMPPGGAFPGVGIQPAPGDRASDRPLYQLWLPLGFYVEDPNSDEIIRPFVDYEEFPDAELSDFEPDKAEFPTGRRYGRYGQ